MPMPFALDHINLWVLEEDAGWTIVDTGLGSDDVQAAWESLLAPTGALGAKPVVRVVSTHMHPDHVGMAGWLTQRFDCALWMTRLEYLSCRLMAADTGRAAPEDGIRFYRRAGWSEASIESYRRRFGDFGRLIRPLPESFVRLIDGQLLRIGSQNWQVIVGRGHSPEHACLYCAELNLLISGDQVLPKISSNTSVFPTEPDADPLTDWLETIERLRTRVPATALVLPAHNEPFIGLHARLDRLRQSALHGADRVIARLDVPMRAMDLVGAIYRSSIIAEQVHLNLATGETIANLNYLMRRSKVISTVDDDDVAWYQRAPEL
ncbi:MAG: MBL fold metallo-hydrolase [Hyphomicrobiales bacterium]|nr:MAG: MBL fold metallo-hydrolase [Hyphomicrobiales bacterium]